MGAPPRSPLTRQVATGEKHAYMQPGIRGGVQAAGRGAVGAAASPVHTRWVGWVAAGTKQQQQQACQAIRAWLAKETADGPRPSHSRARPQRRQQCTRARDKKQGAPARACSARACAHVPTRQPPRYAHPLQHANTRHGWCPEAAQQAYYSARNTPRPVHLQQLKCEAPAIPKKR